jgi:predicted kinase
MSLDAILNSVETSKRVERPVLTERAGLTMNETLDYCMKHWLNDQSKAHLIITVGMGEWGRDQFIANMNQKMNGKLVVCAADDSLFVDGVYKFNPTLLSRAHAKCQSDAYNALRSGKTVLIANTNCELKHIKEYSIAGSRHRFNQPTIVIKFMPSNVESAVSLGTNNTKKVPASVYTAVYEKMQTLKVTRENLPSLLSVMTVCGEM